ncbi:hypothetical protein VNO77_25850 [Canavalia gladiata]|uniref:Ribonuclease H1 N-terminal domain-containing protein n=1 Tax=Canavalia gladiata TaxID=3824 RepID=A0AAN9KS76_CANGL
MNPSLGKSFAFYALVRGARKGIYYSYPVLKATVGEKRNCYWKGFYSFQEAYDFLLEFCDQNEEIFIEREVHGAIESTLEEEISDLKQVLNDGRKELRRLEQLLSLQARRAKIKEICNEQFSAKMKILPSFRNNFLTELKDQPGGIVCCNKIYCLAQDLHYEKLRDLQEEILILPYVKTIPRRQKIKEPWISSYIRKQNSFPTIFTEYSPLLTEVQLRNNEKSTYPSITQKLEEYYWYGMVAAIHLHEDVPTPTMFGNKISQWIDDYRRVICLKDFCTIQVYSSFPQYKLSLHSEGAKDRYFG